jgi:hypothetical protein
MYKCIEERIRKQNIAEMSVKVKIGRPEHYYHFFICRIAERNRPGNIRKERLINHLANVVLAS